jgi:alpha-D-ribose 1-methylphosphonate 5-triphosphate synthase subunit PhnG
MSIVTGASNLQRIKRAKHTCARTHAQKRNKEILAFSTSGRAFPHARNIRAKKCALEQVLLKQRCGKQGTAFKLRGITVQLRIFVTKGMVAYGRVGNRPEACR